MPNRKKGWEVLALKNQQRKCIRYHRSKEFKRSFIFLLSSLFLSISLERVQPKVSRMKISSIVLAVAALPAVAGFLPSGQKSLLSGLRENTAKLSPESPLPQLRWSDEGCSTQLQMAFKSDEPSNMFDGPLPLTRERDACGVGFIANTQTGGE